MAKTFTVTKPAGGYKANKESDMTPKETKPKATTVYMNEDIHTRLKMLSLKQKTNLSDLIVEACSDLLKKYGE